MTALAVITILSLGVPGEVIGTLVLWAIALAFWIVYLVNRRNWWAIIPAGPLTVIGLMPLLSLSDVPVQFTGGVFFLGLSAVFGLIYLVNRRDPQMFWPVYPAAVLLAIGIGVSVFGQNWWPLVLVALGVVLLARALVARRP
jgi:NhaP-type Na+/H+ or K+/H+ antiporter